MGNRYVSDPKYAEGAIYIAPEVMKRAAEEGKIDLLACENEKARINGKHNIYLKITGTRLVLLHVSYSHYVVIDERVWCGKTRRWIHVVKRLANGFHFYLRDGEVRTNPRKKQKTTKQTMLLYRIIYSLMMFSSIDELDSDWHVHHVMDRYFNMISCLRYLEAEQHRKYHYATGNKSKRAGDAINNYSEFCKFINDIKRIDRTTRVIPM